MRAILLVASVFVSLVPERYRKSWPIRDAADMRGPAMVSGMLEFLIGAPGSLLYVGEAFDVAKQGGGFSGLILNPFLPFVFIFAEGGVRFLAALSSGEILPTLPLFLIAAIHNRTDAKAAEHSLGSRVIDQVERSTGKRYDLRVFSCRPKPHWNSYMTIRFDNEFYQLSGEERASGPRQFVYLLRKNPVGRIVVVVYEYSPEDVLDPNAQPKRWRPE